MASWGPDDGEPHKKPDWCDIWQYTSKGSVHGIGSGCVDCDILYNEEMKLLISKPSKDVIIDVIVNAPEGVNVNINIIRN